MKSTFREWTLDKIDDAFNTRQTRQHSELTDWMNFEYECDDFEKKYLRRLQETLVLGVDSWNEEELAIKFIGPVIVFAQFDNEAFAYFFERELAASIGEHDINGRVDGMIATGFRNPKKPYFCMNEYKRQTDPDGDPAGQALAAMIAAQHLNNDGNIIYGCYIIGRMWRFMLLDGKKYTISKSYNSDDEEIFDIFRILKGLKVRVEKFSSQNS